jgi:hypothetical protein
MRANGNITVVNVKYAKYNMFADKVKKIGKLWLNLSNKCAVSDSG